MVREQAATLEQADDAPGAGCGDAGDLFVVGCRKSEELGCPRVVWVCVDLGPTGGWKPRGTHGPPGARLCRPFGVHSRTDKSPFADRRTRQAGHRHRPYSEHERSRSRAGHMPGTCEIRVLRMLARSVPLPQPPPERSRGSPVPRRRGANPRAYGADIRRRQSLAGPPGRGAVVESKPHAMCGRDPGTSRFTRLASGLAWRLKGRRRRGLSSSASIRSHVGPLLATARTASIAAR